MRGLAIGLWAGMALLWGAALADLRLVRMVPLRYQTDHVQGIEFDGQSLWVTAVNSAGRSGSLHEFRLSTGEHVRRVQVEQGERFHPGGIAADGDSLWVPVAEYRRESSAVIQKRSKRTLELESSFEVADHIGCVAATPEGIVGGNWDSRDFYVWDRQGKLLRKVANTAGTAYQDLKFEGGQIVASGLRPDKTGAIDWLEYPSFRLIKRLTAGNTDTGAPYTREGMAVRGKRLLLLPEDTNSRLFEFQLDR